MKTVENGQTVSVHYVGTFPDGTQFDNSRKRGATFDFQVGKGQVLKGFETAVIGMSEGEVRTVNLTPENAYGPVNPEAILTAAKDQISGFENLKVGEVIQGKTKEGQTALATVREINEEKVVLDMNHPMAGKELNFEIELVKIQAAE